MVSLLPHRKLLSFITEWSHSCLVRLMRRWRLRMEERLLLRSGPAAAENVSRSRGSRSELTCEAVEGAEDPETGASLSELKTSFLSAMDPDVETLDEYEVRLSQGVEMARADCRDEALSYAEGMLGEAQYKTAYARFQKFATYATSQAKGPDVVLRGIGAGISGLLQKPGADPVAIYSRYDGAVRAYRELGGTDSSGRVQARLQSLHEKAENALDARSLPPSSAGSVRSSQDWLWENCGLVLLTEEETWVACPKRMLRGVEVRSGDSILPLCSGRDLFRGLSTSTWPPPRIPPVERLPCWQSFRRCGARGSRRPSSRTNPCEARSPCSRLS